MTKVNLIIALIIHFVTLSSSQAQELEWIKSFHGPEGITADAIAVDSLGNVYTTGTFGGTCDFDPGVGTFNQTSTTIRSIFIHKMDAFGNLLWTKSFGGGTSNEIVSIAIDAIGNIYTVGRFEGIADFDPGAGTTNLTSQGQHDVFMQKMDADGNLIWAKSFGGSLFDVGSQIVLDDLGNAYVTGSFEGTADFNPGAGIANLTSMGGYDNFVLKINSSGNFLWARAFGGNSYDYAYSVAVDGTGNVYTTGSFFGTVDFDPGNGTTNLTSQGQSDVFIQKLNSFGSFVWARSFGGAYDNRGFEIRIDNSENIYVSGVFIGTSDFDPGAGVVSLTSLGGTNVFIEKLDSSGDFIWAKSFEGTSNDWSRSIAVDDSCNIYTTGHLWGTTDFDPGPGIFSLTTAGNKDIFIQKMDSSGIFKWAMSFGGISGDEGLSITVNSTGNVYTLGDYRETVDFDPGLGVANLTSSGYMDVFVQKLNQCTPTTGTDIITSCNSYTWIDGNVYTSSNNSATHILVSSMGCDSIVTLDLTIDSVSDISTTLSGMTVMANNNNPSTTYQWLNCNSNFAPINGEVNQTFTPSAGGNYSVQLTENGCVDTSECVLMSAASLPNNDTNKEPLLLPNPTSGPVTIYFGSFYNNVTIIVRDAVGRKKLTHEIEYADRINLSLGDETGLYFVEVRTINKNALLKVIRN